MRAHLFQYGWEDIARTIPSPMPRKVIPVVCILNPCPLWKIMGNAWNAKYRIPSISAVLWA